MYSNWSAKLTNHIYHLSTEKINAMPVPHVITINPRQS